MFIYRIEGNGISMEVTVQGNRSVTIHDVSAGIYTVTEQNGWSLRYNSGNNISQDVSVQLGGNNTALFDGTKTEPYWLSRISSLLQNIFGKKGATVRK